MKNDSIITSEGNKTRNWIIEKARDIVGTSSGSIDSKKTDVLCWNMFNQVFNDKDYEYLTQEGDMAYPAKLRWISLQRTYCNFLISQQTRRPFPFSVYVEDTDSVAEKYDEMMKDYMLKVMDQTKRKVDEHIQVLQGIEQKKQEIQRMLQKEPESEEEAQQQQQLAEQLPLIEQELEHVSYLFEKSLSIPAKDLDKLEQFYKYEYKDTKEQIAQKMSKALRRILNIKEISNRNFVPHIVTGKEYYYVDQIPGEKYPRFEKINDVKVYYPTNTGSEWVQEGPWVAINESKSYSEVVEEYDLSTNDLKKLQNASDHNAPGSFVSTQGNKAVDYDTSNTTSYGGNLNDGQNINIWRIWFKSPRKISRRRKPNPNEEGAFFSHITNEEDLLKRPLASDEELQHRYVNDIYECVIINGDIVPVAKKKDVIVRSADNYSKVLLPVVGPSFNELEAPFSLIWNTKDIQILWNIVHYHRELMLAASGVKGQIIDLSQLPEGMSREEQAYHRKTGKLYIQTVMKGGRRVNSAYNQWKDFDDSISPSIQYLDNMLFSLKETMGEMMGVTRQSLGITVPTDQVGTAELSRDQSALVTEIIHKRHDEVERRAIVQLLNLAAKYTYKDGGLLQFTDIKEGTQYVKIPPGLLSGSDFNILLEDSMQEERDMHDLKIMAARHHEKGMLPFRELVSMYNINSLKELEMKLKHYADQAEELRAQQAQEQIQNEAQMEEQKLRLQAEYQKTINEAANEINVYKTKLEEARLTLDREKMDKELGLKDKEIEYNKGIKLLEIAAENEIESALLEEQATSNAISHRLQALELQLQAVIEGVKIDEGKKQEQNRHTEKVGEIEVKKADIKRRGKEHISDN